MMMMIARPKLIEGSNWEIFPNCHVIKIHTIAFKQQHSNFPMQSTFVPVISTYPELTYFQCDDACSQMAGFRSMIVLMQSAGVGAVTLNYRCTAVVMLVSDDAAPIRHPGLVRTTSPCILVTSTILQQLSALRRSSVKKSALHQKSITVNERWIKVSIYSNRGAGSNLKVGGHKSPARSCAPHFSVVPLQFEGAQRTPGWAQSCA